MEKKTKNNVAYACAVIKSLILAAVFCLGAVIEFDEGTLPDKIIGIVIAVFFTAQFVQALRSRKNVNMTGHALNLMFLILFAANYYYYLKGDSLPFIIGIVVYILLDLTAYILAEKPEKRLTFTSKPLYPKLMAALAMVLFIVSPLFSADGFSLPRLTVYIVLMIIPSVFYCKLLFGGEQELRNTDAGKILMGQGPGMTALLICILTLIKESEITFVPTILFAAVCLCDVVISFILKKE